MKPQRNRLLAKIHVLKKQRGFSDEDYRFVLSERYGKDSAGKLSLKQLLDFTGHLEGHDTPSRSKQPQPELKNDPQYKKMWALWQRLHSLGEVRNPSSKSLAAFIKRHTGVESAKWLTIPQASMVIEILKKWLKRVERKKATGTAI